MERKDVRIGQIVTVSIDLETPYKVEKISGGKVHLINMTNREKLIANIVDLKLVVS